LGTAVFGAILGKFEPMYSFVGIPIFFLIACGMGLTWSRFVIWPLYRWQSNRYYSKR
jgi:hypothetical protein